MSRPLLQLALDHTSLEAASRDVAPPRRSPPLRRATPSRRTAAEKFRSSCSATGRWMTPVPGTALASVRRFTIAAATPRPADNSGVTPIWRG